MKFVFVSHGISDKGFKEISKLVSKKAEDTNVLFIDTPANAYPPNPPWLAESRKELTDSGFRVTDLDIETAFKNKRDIKGMVSKSDIVAVSGGNTFYFLYWAEKIGLKKILLEFMQSGGIYMGESAGVMCQVKDLTPVALLDDPTEAPGVVKHGMQLTNVIAIPHWGTPKYQKELIKVRDYYESKGLKVHLLKDGEIIILDNKELRKIK